MKLRKVLTALLMCAFVIPEAQSNPIMDKDTSISDAHYNDMLNSFETLEFGTDQYFLEVTPKTQHCLHHTASGKGVNGDYQHFLNPGKIATPIIIGHDKVVQLFKAKYWGYHLGIPELQFAKMKIKYQRLDKICIGTEIDSWGQLKFIDGEFRAYINDFGTGSKLDKKGNPLKVIVPEAEVVHYPNKYRGFEFYQAYNKFQIDTVGFLCQYYNREFGIPMDYHEEIWDVYPQALKGVPGTYVHGSYRPDKRDCHPQPELVEKLKSLV